MSIDEQDRILGQTVRELREKKTELLCLRKQATDITRILETALKLHDKDKHDMELAQALDQLTDETKVVQPFREIIQVKSRIAELERILAL